MAAIIAMGSWGIAAFLWFWGLSEYSLSKGHSSINCLWGVLGLIGLLVLAAKKDEFMVGAPDSGSAYPRGGQSY